MTTGDAEPEREGGRGSVSPVLAILAGIFAVPLLVHAYLGSFMHYLADDFCTAAVLLREGFFGALRHWYTSSGRYAFIIAIDAVEYAGPQLVPVLPLLAILLWSALLTWALAEWARVGGRRGAGWAALVLALVLLFATLERTPTILQSLYWRTGMLTYTAPLVVLCAFVALVGFLLRRGHERAPPGYLALGAGLTFVAGGFSDLFTALQVCALALALAAAVLLGAGRQRQVAPAMLGAGLAGALASLLLVLAAPGNELRQEYFDPPTALPRLVGLSLSHAVYFVGNALTDARPLTLLALMMVPLLLGWYLAVGGSEGPAAAAGSEVPAAGTAGRVARRVAGRASLPVIALFTLPPAAFLLVLSAMAPEAYGLGAGEPSADGVGYSTPLPGRAHIIPIFALFACVAGWFVALGICVRRRWPERPIYLLLLGLATVAAAAPLLAATRTMAEVPTWRAYAQSTEARHRHLVAAAARGEQEVVVRPVLHEAETGLRPFEPSVTGWVNECAARYYGVASISVDSTAAPYGTADSGRGDSAPEGS